MIEAATGETAPLLAALHAQAFPERAWSEAEIADLLRNPTAFAFTWRGGDAPVGFALGWTAAGEAELLTVAVVPDARRGGVGQMLLNAICAAALLRGAASLHLEVAEDNEPARRLYAKLGFEEVGRRRGYYADGQTDAIVMRRTLPRPNV